VRALLGGAPGSRVCLELVSPGRGREERCLQRAHLELSALQTVWLDGEAIAYVRLRRLELGVARELEATLRAWRWREPRALLLDLRGNPGGLFDEASAIADLFLPPGCAIARTFARRPEERERVTAQRPAYLYGVPLLVLCDAETASSAELLAGALQAAGVAVLAGTPTYGKWSIQRIKPLAAGGALKVTTSRFATRGDRPVCGGLRPNLALAAADSLAASGRLQPRPSDLRRDPWVRAGLSYLLGDPQRPDFE